MGTGSLDFQAALVPVPRSLQVGGGAATSLAPEVAPVHLSAAGVAKECLPVVTAMTLCLVKYNLWYFEQEFNNSLARILKLCVGMEDGEKRRRSGVGRGL